MHTEGCVGGWGVGGGGGVGGWGLFNNAAAMGHPPGVKVNSGGSSSETKNSMVGHLAAAAGTVTLAPT